MTDKMALERITLLVARGENCLACKLCRQMCMDCLYKRDPKVKLLRASKADKKYGLSPSKRQILPYVEWHRGFQAHRRMYLESDLKELEAKTKKSKK